MYCSTPASIQRSAILDAVTSKSKEFRNRKILMINGRNFEGNRLDRASTDNVSGEKSIRRSATVHNCFYGALFFDPEEQYHQSDRAGYCTKEKGRVGMNGEQHSGC